MHLTRLTSRGALTAALALLTLAAPATSSAEATVTRAEVPFSFPVDLLASSCSGATVAMTGHIDATITTTIAESGNTHSTITVRYSGVTGTNVLTGRTFLSDYTQTAEVTSGPAIENTVTVSGKFLETGESGGLTGLGDDLFLHSVVHATVPANGGLPTASVDNVNAGCR